MMLSSGRWNGFLHQCGMAVAASSPWVVTGRLTRVAGLVMEAVGIRLAVGSSCVVYLPDGHDVDAEVVGFSGDKLFLMPSSDIYGLVPGARVVPTEPEKQYIPRIKQPFFPHR